MDAYLVLVVTQGHPDIVHMVLNFSTPLVLRYNALGFVFNLGVKEEVFVDTPIKHFPWLLFVSHNQMDKT